jgi:hypothetical protein
MQGGVVGSTLKYIFPMFTNTVFEETYNGIKDPNSVGLPQFPTGIDVINEFNQNYGFVSFLAHGSPTTVAVASNGYNKSPKYRIHTDINSPKDKDPQDRFLSDISNYGYPNIFYSISCETMPFDNLGSGNNIVNSLNMGEGFTILSKAGSVAYLGNTRNSYLQEAIEMLFYFSEEIDDGNFNLGIAEANSRFSLGSQHSQSHNIFFKGMAYGHNLLGCPEMKMWTDIPAKFTTATVSQSGTTVTVNTGSISGCKIALTSMDYGESYFEVAENVSSHTFTGVNVPYYVTITKHNYIPYQYPQDVYIQNETITNDSYITGRNIYVGNNVTNTKPQGDVKITNNARVIFDAEANVIFDKGFQCELGSTFEVVKK